MGDGDIKPDNILLDEEGHFHITDFNIATVLEDSHLATSMSGTKPYIAPEIFDCAMDLCVGYAYPVDWWSLGVVAYEMLRGLRPFDIHSNTSMQEVRILFQIGLDYPSNWSEGIIDLISRLLCISPGLRISTIQELKQVKCLKKFDTDRIFQRQYKPYFMPPKDHLNCDPTFELEEMIIETKPLHKKKKRLAKQRSIREIQGPMSIELDADSPMDLQGSIIPDFKVYNRYQELEKRERERKEQAWERELELAMRSSDPLKEETEPKEKLHKCTGCPKLETMINSNCKMKKYEESEGSESSNKSQLQLPERKNEEKLCSVSDIQNKLQNIDFIDRTPSPVERTEGT
ncbi:hypothetical protein MTP99_017141 [Tenebrio molitor]|nr:hypothetical protein MTP99_017141 [Tenebrio molitor]